VNPAFLRNFFTPFFERSQNHLTRSPVQGPLFQRHDPARLPLPDPGPVPPLPPHPRAQRQLVLRLQLRLLGERGAARRKQPGSLARSGARFPVKDLRKFYVPCLSLEIEGHQLRCALLRFESLQILCGRPRINGTYWIAATAV
jgi:hypothetical protein